MIYYLYGADSYRLQQKIKEIVARFLEINPGGAWERLDSQQIEWPGFWDLLNQQSLFVKKKLLVMDNLFLNSQLSQVFLTKIKEIAASCHIVIITNYLEKVKKGSKDNQGKRPAGQDLANKAQAKKLEIALKKYGQGQEFELLNGPALKQWVQQEFKKYGVTTETIALTKLLVGVGSDMWRLAQEINKLANYKKLGSVTAGDIDKLVALGQSAQIFAPLDALASRNKKQALGLLLNHLQKGESIFYLLSMLAFQFRNLLMLKAAQGQAKESNNHLTVQQLAKVLELNPFVVKKTSVLANYFSLAELKHIYQKIFNLDLALKTSSLAAQDALRLLVAEV